jgi:two-component sensor histidine kinase
MRRDWVWIAGIWSAIAIANATQTVFGMMAQGMQHYWFLLFGMVALTSLPWALATPLIVDKAHQHPPVASSGLRGLAIHFTIFIAVSLIYALWCAWIQNVMQPWGPGATYGPTLPLAWAIFFSYLHMNLITYAAILAIVYTLASRQRIALNEMETSRLNAELSLARLESFRRQLAPHFLFNALNGISGLVRSGSNEQAVGMIAGFSEFLRNLLRHSDRQQIPLAEELECLNQYVEIQRMRFADRLKFETEIPLDLRTIQIPTLLLQPVVENAIEHGIGKRAGGGVISVTATRSTDAVTICVYNDGPALPLHWDSASGIGVRNTQARLKSLFGDAGSFHLRNGRGRCGVEAIVTLPCATV